MTGYLLSDQYFNNIHACSDTVLHPKGPSYMSTHLQTIATHFNGPSCYITTDEVLSRDHSHLASLPANYPWIFMLDIYQDISGRSQLISTRYFFRDLKGDVAARPYVEITEQESLNFLKQEFQEEKPRTGLWMCQAEDPWDHFEHWGRQYVVRFLKKKQQPNADQSPNFASKGNDWGKQLPLG